MAQHDFQGPVNNDKTAVFLRYNGLAKGSTATVTAAANLVKSIRDAADSSGRWAAVTTWAGAADANTIRLPAAITELPDFVAPPNRQNIETYDGSGQTVQVLGIATTPDLDLTITLYNPSDTDHQLLRDLPDQTMLDILVMTATTWRAANTGTLDGSALEASGFAALCVAGKPFRPGGAAGDFSRLTIPLAYRDSEFPVVVDR